MVILGWTLIVIGTALAVTGFRLRMKATRQVAQTLIARQA